MAFLRPVPSLVYMSSALPALGKHKTISLYITIDCHGRTKASLW